MSAATDFDLDAYLRECHEVYRYLNQGKWWAPRPPRKPLPVADMDLEWRHNAANFLMRKAESLAHRYAFGMVQSAGSPKYHGEAEFDGRMFSEFDLMSDLTREAFDAEPDRITAEPEVWLRTTALYRALVADLPDGEEREQLAARAAHWSTCPARTGGKGFRCAEIREQCDRCRSGQPCLICSGEACGWCPDCSPGVPD